MPVLCACTVLKSLQEMVTPEGTLYRPDFRVFLPVCQQFSVMIFILLLPCLKVNLCVCVQRQCIYTDVLLTGSSFEMQHGILSSASHLLN